MELSSHTTQAELSTLYRIITRREMLRSTPLNLRMFLRYAVLFVLFPGMIAGFRTGLALTLVFCIALSGLLFSGHQSWAVEAVRVWLSAGVCILAWVSWRTTYAALKLSRKRHTPRPADAPSSGATAQKTTLLWQPAADGRQAWETELVHEAQEPGIYALLLCVQGAERCRLITPDQQGVCILQRSATGSELQTLLLYRMEKGCHRLRFILAPKHAAKPQAEATWLAGPHFPQMLQK